MICPDCNGRKHNDAFVNRGEQGCSWEKIPCSTCHGAGDVSDDYAERRDQARAEGQALRADRNERDETLLQAAIRLNMTVVEYSRLERGVVLP